MSFGTPLASQVKAVALGIFFGYPVPAIQAYLTMMAHRRGWITLTEEEACTSYGRDVHSLGFIPAPEHAEMSRADLCFLVNSQRYASWPFGDKMTPVPPEPKIEEELAARLKDRAFNLRVEKALEQLKLYTCPKSVHVPTKEY